MASSKVQMRRVLPLDSLLHFFIIAVFVALSATVAHATVFATRARRRPRSPAPAHRRRADHASSRRFRLHTARQHQHRRRIRDCRRRPSASIGSPSPLPASPPSRNRSRWPRAPTPWLHIMLAVAPANADRHRSRDWQAISRRDSATPTTLITRAEIDETPGASRTIGMEMITDYVPGAYMTHDMLHMRGGHQTSWLIDGIAIPNTKIASNVGPQIDPKDIDSLETAARQLRGRCRRPHLRRLQCAAAQWLRAQPRGRAAGLRRQPRHRRSAALARRPLRQERPGTRASPAPAPTTAWPRRSPQIYHDATNSQSGFRLADSQPDAQGSTAPRRAISPGLLRHSLRPEPERLGAG